MGIRYQYDGYNLASLRRWATELAAQGYPIKGRSKMTGWVLLGEVRAANVRRCRDAERRFLDALGAAPVVGKHVAEPCGCRVEVTSGIESGRDFDGYAPLFVRGRYLEQCSTCQETGSPLHVTNRNGDAVGGYRFFLNRVTLVPRPVDPARAQAKVDQVLRPDPLDAKLDAAFGPLEPTGAGPLMVGTPRGMVPLPEVCPPCSCQRKPHQPHSWDCAIIAYERRRIA